MKEHTEAEHGNGSEEIHSCRECRFGGKSLGDDFQSS